MSEKNGYEASSCEKDSQIVGKLFRLERNVGAERALTYRIGVLEGRTVLVGAMSLYTPCAEEGSI